MSKERIAKMNPEAVDEAIVFSGLVYYYDRGREEHIEIVGSPFVEVGKWTTEGNEQIPEDYDCAYWVATILGYKSNMAWLPAQEGIPTEEERTGERKYLIHNGSDESGKIIPFSEGETALIAEEINFVLAATRQAKAMGEDFQKFLRQG